MFYRTLQGPFLLGGELFVRKRFSGKGVPHPSHDNQVSRLEWKSVYIVYDFTNKSKQSFYQ